jgi:preprotein translocase subunit SecE
MASRAQRRAQRRAQGRGASGGGTPAPAGGSASAAGGGDQSFSQRARSRQQQVRPSQQPVRGQTGRREAQRGSFIRESIAELRKVEWPDQRQVTTGTVVVIIACAITGAYLWVNDLVWQRLVEAIL